ncbi:hypothetical protein [Pseudoclavibacter sp. AY1H1]|uniref:hypothetical protein n=1 Tax=Pseudoclavibacter sp. AY1H1 TaxID=2080584 RepID=UPI000CE8FE60|nr:hypothetical protein [Pseudoclavibacter sp. AY1H1]PPF32614.1 hypothetical protein C5E05_19105 [Pseudoclavibacter sp. AY1H1]
MAQPNGTTLSTLTAAQHKLEALKAEAALGTWSPFSLATSHSGTRDADALALLVTLLPPSAASLLTVMCHHVVVDEVLHVLSLAAHEERLGRSFPPRALRLAEVILQQASSSEVHDATPKVL